MRFRAFLWSDFRLLIDATRIVSLPPRYLQLQDLRIYKVLRVDKTHQVINLNADNSAVEDSDFGIWHMRHGGGVHSQ